MKKISFKITSGLDRAIRSNLQTRHKFAAERVGFIACSVASLDDGLILLAKDYYPVDDDDYIDDMSVGAMMGPAAIRKALKIAYIENMCMFHVHMHEHRGVPSFSKVDLRESSKFIPDFWNVRPKLPHGTIVLSHDLARGLCWTPNPKSIFPITDITVTGSPLSKIWRRS
ncbi:hypothetical protein [Methylotenera sp.]|uniref:hypothetical protein n=1 Tax=Methylotenera sp. TaxID=2051956 RepID=UPI002EDA8678